MFIGIFQLCLRCHHCCLICRSGSVNAVFTRALLRAVATPEHRDDVGAVEQPVQQPLSYDRVGKERIEILGRPVRGQQKRATTVAPTDINFARALIESAGESVNLTALVECQTTTTDAKSV